MDKPTNLIRSVTYLLYRIGIRRTLKFYYHLFFVIDRTHIYFIKKKNWYTLTSNITRTITTKQKNKIA